MAETHLPGLPVPVLGDREGTPALGGETGLRVLVDVHHGEAAEEEYRIGVLLDGAGVTQVGQHVLQRGSRLAIPVQLAQQHDGDVVLLGDQL